MEMNLNKFSKVRLNNKIEIPCIGLGTYGIHGKDVLHSIEIAYEAGYRLIDTAKFYANEKEIGDAIKTLEIPREDIFVTTKLDSSDHGYKSALKGFEQSLEKLQLEYIDLYLIHWPNSNKRLESWKALEELYSKKLCKSIGVCNYTEYHLTELLKNSSVVPAINQIEFNPFCFQNDILSYCKSKNIQVEGYTPLARMHKKGRDELKPISEKYNKTQAQILLRWSIQHGVIVIPKSSNKERIHENIDLFDFELSKDEMSILNTFDENLRSSPDPHNIR
jgi:diketogulonate reductase-like aldo/keto reductase